MKKIIVTGGCGYIGSHVARAFKMQGDQVYIIDRIKREHALKGIDEFVLADYAGHMSLSAISRIDPDIIVHCAGTSLVGPSVTDPADYYYNNVAKTIELLNYLATRSKKPAIIFSSSASVYGEPEVIPIPETHNLKPISPYGNTKLIIETVLKDYSNAYGIDSTCFRYFNAAGAEPFDHNMGQLKDATHVVARALQASITGSPFTINGNDYDTADGTCVRDYIHVWDLAMAHIKAADYMYQHSGHHVFNLGTNTGTSNKEIADYIDTKYGFIEFNHGVRRLGDPAKLIADASKANNLLTWTPKYSKINTIIDDAYQWYKSF